MVSVPLSGAELIPAAPGTRAACSRYNKLSMPFANLFPPVFYLSVSE